MTLEMKWMYSNILSATEEHHHNSTETVLKAVINRSHIYTKEEQIGLRVDLSTIEIKGYTQNNLKVVVKNRYVPAKLCFQKMK
jgi:hypothetical protein